MACVSEIMRNNFIEYASHIIKDRVIPRIEDGLYDSERRILRAMRAMETNEYVSVSKVLDEATKHPLLPYSRAISSFTGLLTDGYYIEVKWRYGDFGPAGWFEADDHIECRLSKLARRTLFNDELTNISTPHDEWARDPAFLLVKVPSLLMRGRSGCDVGFRTDILRHNFIELLEAQIAFLAGREKTIAPDLTTGGYIDASRYNDGNGEIFRRAILEVTAPNIITINDHPENVEWLILTIENAARDGKIRISDIVDYSAKSGEIAVKCSDGVGPIEMTQNLYKFTDCETKIPAIFLVLKDSEPVVMSVSEAIRHATGQLVEILAAESSSCGTKQRFTRKTHKTGGQWKLEDANESSIERAVEFLSELVLEYRREYPRKSLIMDFKSRHVECQRS